jgi:MerR HTH family regulatory protein
MGSETSYEVQAVAHAVDIPVRRLEGWIERRVVVPTVRASGTGTRTRFSRQDVLRIAIIAEIQRLFGTDFRPGGVASAIGRDPLTLPWFDTALSQAMGGPLDGLPGSAAGPDARGLLLYVYRRDARRLDIGASRKPLDKLLKTAPVLLLIDPSELWRRIQARLKD